MITLNLIENYSKNKFNELYTGLKTRVQTAKDRFSQLDVIQKTILISASTLVALGSIYYMGQFFNQTPFVAIPDKLGETEAKIGARHLETLCNRIIRKVPWAFPEPPYNCTENGWTKSTSFNGWCVMENLAHITKEGKKIGSYSVSELC